MERERQTDERDLVLLAAKVASGVGTPQDAARLATLRGYFFADSK